jgi:hypothetical protein
MKKEIIASILIRFDARFLSGARLMRSPGEAVFFFFESFSVRCGCSPHWTPAPQLRVRHKDAGQRREPARVGGLFKLEYQ